MIEPNLIVDSRGMSSSSSGGITKSSFLASMMIFALNKQFEPDLGNLNYHLTQYGKVKLLTIALSNENSYYYFAFQSTQSRTSSLSS